MDYSIVATKAITFGIDVSRVVFVLNRLMDLVDGNFCIGDHINIKTCGNFSIWGDFFSSGNHGGQQIIINGNKRYGA